MTEPSVLISGAGIAGPTLAFWLARHGFRPTIVERAQAVRSSSNPVDLRGPALPVVEAMGLVPRLRAAATQVNALRLVDDAGRTLARLPMPGSRRAAGTPDIELPRGDLAGVLVDAARSDTEFLLGDTITALQQDQDGVDVTFDRHAPRRFDLVIGADGLHSAVRRLVFGPDSAFIRHMGAYVGTLPLPGPSDHPHDVLIYNTPGRMVAEHPVRGQAGAAFIFRQAAVAGFDHRDMAQHKQIILKAYRDARWRVPELLRAVEAADDLYFDAISQVRLPVWSRGRVALLGDAASCLSLFGDGSTLATAGAYTLASALAAHPADHTAAFQHYEREHRAQVAPRLWNFGLAAALLLPKTRAGLTLRNLAARLWSKLPPASARSPQKTAP